MRKILIILNLLICLSAIEIGAQCVSNQPVYLADVDGDGRSDAIVVNSDSVTVRRSSGLDFGNNEPWTTNPYYGQRGIFFADVTGDRRADAIVVNDNETVVRRSSGSRFLSNESWTEIGYYGRYGNFFADVDGDGRADAIVVNENGVTVRRSTGRNFRGNEAWITNSYDSGVSFSNKDKIFFADVTGDGRADMITVNDGLVSVRRSTGRNFQASETWYNNSLGNQKISVADVTGDGSADIVSLSNRSRGNILLIAGGSRFSADNDWLETLARDDSPLSDGRRRTSQIRGDKDTVFADVDGDKRADAVLINNNRVEVRLASQRGFRNSRPWTLNPYSTTSDCLGN